MKKFISLFTALVVSLSCASISFATTPADTIVIDGNQYVVERFLTNEYSRAIIKNTSTQEIISDFTYHFDSKYFIRNN